MTVEELSALSTLLKNEVLTDKAQDAISKLLDAKADAVIEAETKRYKHEKQSSKQTAIAALQMEKARTSRQEVCMHLKYNEAANRDETFLSGQFLQVPPNTLVLFCQDDRCQKVFSIPAHPEHGWELPPSELVPRRGLGGVGDMASLIMQAQAANRKQAQAAAGGTRNS